MTEDPKPSEKPDKQDREKADASSKPAKTGKKVARRSSARKSSKDSPPPSKDSPPPSKDSPPPSKEENADPGGKGMASGKSAEDSSGGSGGRRRRSRGGRDTSSARASTRHDPQLLVKHAWKIYLGEINEEGVTLMDDKAARQLAVRSFELAGIFLDEQARRAQD